MLIADRRAVRRACINIECMATGAAGTFKECRPGYGRTEVKPDTMRFLDRDEVQRSVFQLATTRRLTEEMLLKMNQSSSVEERPCVQPLVLLHWPH